MNKIHALKKYLLKDNYMLGVFLEDTDTEEIQLKQNRQIFAPAQVEQAVHETSKTQILPMTYKVVSAEEKNNVTGTEVTND